MELNWLVGRSVGRSIDRWVDDTHLYGFCRHFNAATASIKYQRIERISICKAKTKWSVTALNAVRVFMFSVYFMVYSLSYLDMRRIPSESIILFINDVTSSIQHTQTHALKSIGLNIMMV